MEISKIQNTSTYKKYCRIVQTSKERINLENIQKEIITLHLSRESSNLIKGKNFTSSRLLLQVTSQERAIRARLTNILLSLVQQSSIIEDANKAFTRYAIANHNDILKIYSTKEQRTSFIQYIIEDGISYLNEIQYAISSIELLIKDIDQASFDLNRLKDLHQLISEKGRTN